MVLKKVYVLGIMVLLLFVTNGAVAQIVDLGTLPGGTTSYAYGINNLGQVVGLSNDTIGNFHAVVWDRTGAITDLGTLPGGTASYAYSINDLGQITGSSFNAEGDEHATLWNTTTGTITDLGTLGGPNSYANGINNLGQIAGSSYNANGEERATLWNATTGEMIDLGTLGGTVGYAYNINNFGQVVGLSTDTNNLYQNATLWNITTGTITDLGAITGGEDSYAVDINNIGQIVGGYYDTSGNLHATLWNAKTMTITDLGTLGGRNSYAFGINNLGQIVGGSENTIGNFRAAIWNATTGTIKDLGTLGGPNSNANGINDLGQIVGWSDDANNNQHAALWIFNGSISGTVKSFSGGIAGATVTAGNISTTTNSTGWYNINIPSGIYNVTANAYGFEFQKVTDVVVTAGKVTYVNFDLKPITLSGISGTVTDASNKEPIAGAIVAATLNGTSWITGKTDSKGKYSIIADPGKYHVSASAKGYETNTTIVVVAYRKVTIQNFSLKPNSTIIGIVTDATTHKPIVGANVKAGNISTFTNSKGQYNMSIVPGKYLVTARAKGYESNTTTVNAISGKTIVENFSMIPNSTIIGIVTDAITHKPIVDTIVTAGNISTFTNPRGQYYMNIVPGKYLVTARAKGYESNTTTVNAISGKTIVENFSMIPNSTIISSVRTLQTRFDSIMELVILIY